VPLASAVPQQLPLFPRSAACPYFSLTISLMFVPSMSPSSVLPESFFFFILRLLSFNSYLSTLNFRLRTSSVSAIRARRFFPLCVGRLLQSFRLLSTFNCLLSTSSTSATGGTRYPHACAISSGFSALFRVQHSEYRNCSSS